MKDEKEPLFLPAPFFMIRTPLFPIKDFFSFVQHKDPRSFFNFLDAKQTSYMREAIAIASPSLYDAIINQKENNQIEASLLKYFSRITTRSTPFGLFSFVSIGSWGESTSVNIDFAKITKRVRPDMEWLFNLIDQLSLDPQLLPLFLVKKNPLVFESTGRTCLNYYRKKNVEEETKTISIRTSYLTQAIFEIAQNPIRFIDLVNKIIELYPKLESNKIQRLIEQLIQQQYLLLNLQPSLLTESPFNDLLGKFSSISIPADDFQDIATKIENYNDTQIGQGESACLDLIAALRKKSEAQNYIQVDSAYTGEDLTINHSVAKELAEAVEVVWRISNESREYSLRSYHKKFLEKYGMYRIIPLLELLHEESGLGTPDIYLEKPNNNAFFKVSQDSKWNRWLKNQWVQCLHQDKQEIELTDELINKLISNHNKNKALPSFDVFCEIISNSANDINNGDFLLSIVNNSWQGGATFGRFTDLFSAKFKEKLKYFFLEEEALEKGSLFLQSSYLSVVPRHANVAIHSNLRRSAIDLESPSQLSLNDIYVGANSERFFLTLKDSNQELIITTGNMLNNSIAPIPLRLIRDISDERYALIVAYLWNSYEDAPFLPRVRYKKTILSAARWKIDLLKLNLDQKDSLKNIKEKFQKWAQDWKIPRYIFLGKGDKRILMDLEFPAHIHEICSQIKKGDSVTLVEKIGQTQGQWVQSNQGTHISEIIVPFIKNSRYSYQPHISPTVKNYSTSIKNRRKLPGSEWLFIKYYLWSEHEDRFLTDQLFQFINSLLQENLITEWFFVRYEDTKSHLRIRFKGNKEVILSKLLPTVHDWTAQLLEQQCINDITISSYEKEVERYGGEQLIELAESVFYADSMTAIFLIQIMLMNNLAREVIGALSLIDLLRSLGLDLKEQLTFFSSQKLGKENLEGFRKFKNSLVSFGEAIFQDNLANHSDEGALLSQAFQKRKNALIILGTAMQQEKVKRQLTVSPHAIQDSIIHLHCNRLLGRDIKNELKARIYAFYTLIIISEKRSK